MSAVSRKPETGGNVDPKTGRVQRSSSSAHRGIVHPANLALRVTPGSMITATVPGEDKPITFRPTSWGSRAPWARILKARRGRAGLDRRQLRGGHEHVLHAHLHDDAQAGRPRAAARVRH